MQFFSNRFSTVLLVLLVLICASCSNDDDRATPELDILERIQNLNGVTVVELETVDHFERLFEIRMEQPIDHAAPDGEQFVQKIFLGHLDESLPVAFETEGYARSAHKTRELSGFLNCNQLTVEHRFNGESTNQPKEWQYLNIWQAANDHHRIVELFKTLYPAAWVSSGASKGGNAAVFHRRFFPEDVDATVAYVAPFLFELRDQRFLAHFAQAGDEACRERLKNYQRNILMHLDELPPLFESYVADVNTTYGTNITFTLPYESIVYHAIREDYIFEFWSSEIENCNTIPDQDATVEELFAHFVSVFDVFLFFSDYGVEFWTPWYYQSLTEIGNYAFTTDHLQDLTMNIDPLVELSVPTEFDPSAMADIADWVKNEGEKIIFIYGEEDPWTVGALDHSGNPDVFTIINPSTKHGTRIADLTPSDQNFIRNQLEIWLGI